jgi:hypothetical protein
VPRIIGLSAGSIPNRDETAVVAAAWWTPEQVRGDAVGMPTLYSATL